MVRSKVRVEISGVVSEIYAETFLDGVYCALNKSSHPSHLKSIATTGKNAVVRGEWYEAHIAMRPEESPYSMPDSAPKVFYIKLKTTLKHESRLLEVLNNIRPNPDAGYVSSVDRVMLRI